MTYDRSSTAIIADLRKKLLDANRMIYTLQDQLAEASSGPVHSKERNEAKRELVKKLLLAEGGRNRSDRNIANECNVSHQFVGKIRRSVCGAAINKRRIGIDGRTRQCPRKRKEPNAAI